MVPDLGKKQQRREIDGFGPCLANKLALAGRLQVGEGKGWSQGGL